MEVEVRVVGGIESCFASLPLFLIQTLEQTRGGPLPPVLALELRSLSGNRRWNLAWSGSASQSSAIEVAQQLAECISLADRTTVHLKASSVLSKAEYVTIEPVSEDDWEILELNSELAEEVILKQVGVVYEGMKFPLWLHGHVVVEFLVISSSPKEAIVQLVPGTEVAVAPKRRQEKNHPLEDVQNQYSMNEKLRTKALLRVQAAERKVAHKFKYKGVEVGVVLTYAVFMHPETASSMSLDSLQFVAVFPKLLPKELVQKAKDASLRKGFVVPHQERTRHIVVRTLFSDSVAKGHIMFPQSLRRYLRAGIHSWVYVKKCSLNTRKEVPSLMVSPFHFNMPGKTNAEDNYALDTHERDTYWKRNSMPSGDNSFLKGDAAGWLHFEESLASLSNEVPFGEDAKGSYKSRINQEMKLVIKSWLIGQLKAICAHIGLKELTSVVLANETLLHFEVRDPEFGNNIVDLLYLLNVEESYSDNLHDSYKLVLDAVADDLDNLDLTLGKLELGETTSLDSVMEKSSARNFKLTLSSLTWMDKAVSDVTNRLRVLLSPSSRKLFDKLDCPLPGYLLIYGPPGSGKTTLLRAAAKYLEEDKEILAHIVYINCSKLALGKNQKIRQAIADNISEALVHSPSVVIFDDLDNVVSFSSESEGSHSSSSSTALVKYFTEFMDEYKEKTHNFCGFGPIAFMASVQSLGNLPQALTSSGRFDFHVQLSAPAVPEREAILKHDIKKRDLEYSENVISEIASKCDGYDAYDLETLVDRAVHAAASRFLSTHDDCAIHGKTILGKDDFLRAIHDFIPVAMRGLTKAAPQDRSGGWEDVGGLAETRNAIQETIELPSKFPTIFAQSPLRMRSNILLYGAPGCGKTHIVGAAAAASSLRFISVKGPELLNKYIGASEQAVRDIFAKAVTAAPCLLFFDEFDSIAPKRGHDNTGVTDRVVNQLLTELDGVETLTGVFVFAATSRPDLLDAALLRPGRFDRLLFCDFPEWHERFDILTVLSKKLPLASDVNLSEIASMTEGFSGADLQALLSDAQLAAVHELLDSGANDKPGSTPVISDGLLNSVALKARPSISESEKRRLNDIYNQFLESKKSVSAQARESKGKRATLA